MRLNKCSIPQLLAALSLSLLMALPTSAMDLGKAKSSGLVGETNTGYIAAIKPSAEVDALVADINNQRKVHYQNIANQNGISLQAVEVRAGLKAIEKTPPGETINTGTGWQIK